MTLESAADPLRLYSAIGPEVNLYRPLFTGDIFTCLEIPGIGMSSAIVIGHPCSFRGRKGGLTKRTPVASVEPHERVPAHLWSKGYFNRMALAGLPLEGKFHVARLDRFGLALTNGLLKATRIACLSHAGINQLQQRLVFHQTRLAVPTAKFHEAFDHTYEESDLLEEWNTELNSTEDDPIASFESWIHGGDPKHQSLLKTPQERAHVRRAMRTEINQRKANYSREPLRAIPSDETPSSR